MASVTEDAPERAAGGADREDGAGGLGRLRSWVASLALISFLAGGLAGVLLERQLSAAEPGPSGPFEDYRQLFSERFDLSPERERLFEQVVQHYQRELEEVRQRALEDSMGTLEPELVRLGLRYRDLIRNHVLPRTDRPEFDRLAQASPWATDPSASAPPAGPAQHP